MSSGTYTLRVGVNTDAARAVEAEAVRLPLLVGLALLILAGVAIALVVRIQTRYLDREKKLVARAEQDRRLASLGRLTAGVAHEIKNPLNTIQLSAGRLQRKYSDIDPKIVAAITRSVTTIARTVEDFMKLARDPGLVLEVGDPKKVLSEAVSQVRPMAATAGRVIEVVAAATHTKVRLDERRLREAFVNLLSNAVQASKGRVEVRLRRDEGACVVHVDDDGPGIDAAHKDEIFEFFFTTKEAGTGLGLPLAHRVAEEHGGSLEVAEAPMGGARFTLRLPCLD
jgi:signal transduction histidine kinase